MKNFLIKHKTWLAIIILAFSTFIFNTTEFLPIAIFSDIATDFHVNESYIGVLLTSYAWSVAIISLPLITLTDKIERKKLYIIIFIGFILCNILSACAWNYIVLLISRIGVACCHAIYWSITAPIAVRLAPLGGKAKALSLISAGTSIAMILGLPLGKFISLYLNWRCGFLIIAILTLLIIIIFIKVFPILHSLNNDTLKKLPLIFKNTSLQIIFILLIIYVTADFILYSYIEPFINQVSHLGDKFIVLVLSILGVFSILGAYLFYLYNCKFPFALLLIALISCWFVFIIYNNLSQSFWSMIIINAIWGVASTIVPMMLVYKTIVVSGNLSDAATALYSGLFNVGIGLSALIGGKIIKHLGIENLGYISASLLFVAIMISIIFRKNFNSKIE